MNGGTSVTPSAASAPVTVLVTGATGFTGTHTLSALMNMDGVIPIAACRNTATLAPNFKGEVRIGDLTDPKDRVRVLKGIDIVAHCASWTAAWGYARASRQHFLMPALAFIEDAVNAGIKRFINVSSTAVAAPAGAANATSVPMPLPHFPHLDNVRKIEEHLRTRAESGLNVVNLRLGFFTGAKYGLGILPLLLPRLKTHLVPWVANGRTHLPLIDGRDIGQAMALAAVSPGLDGYRAFNVIGPENPTVRNVIEHLGEAYGYPTPHFSVPFGGAYAFAWLMEKLDPIVPWEPLVTRSIIQFLEEQDVDNVAFNKAVGYTPRHHWKDSIRIQIAEMEQRQAKPMPMVKPLPDTKV